MVIQEVHGIKALGKEARLQHVHCEAGYGNQCFVQHIYYLTESNGLGMINRNRSSRRWHFAMTGNKYQENVGSERLKQLHIKCHQKQKSRNSREILNFSVTKCFVLRIFVLLLHFLIFEYFILNT